MGRESARMRGGTCTACGLCYNRCPQFTFILDDAERIFGKRPDFEGVGIFKNAYSGRSEITEIRKNSQDGGTVTTLLVSLLESGFIDGAVVTGTGAEPWNPEPYVARTRKEVIDHSGSIYSPSSVLKGLGDAVDHYNIKNLCVVGTPCQVESLRRLKIADIGTSKYSSRVKLIIGLFCMESFPYENIIEIVEERLGLNIGDVSKFDIEKGDFIVHTAKNEGKIPVKELKKFMCSSCEVCIDFAAELADISIGSVGAPAGQNSIITRTSIGEEAFQKVVKEGKIESKPLSKVKPGLKLIEKLSNMKKRERKEEIERRKRENKPIPPWAKKL